MADKGNNYSNKTQTKKAAPEDDDSPRYSLVKKTPSKSKSPSKIDDGDDVKYSLVKKSTNTPSKSDKKNSSRPSTPAKESVKKTPVKKIISKKAIQPPIVLR